MALDPVKLADWLRKATLSPKLPRIKQIVLNHWFSSGDMKPAHVWDWSPEEPIPRVEDLIDEVTDQATTYANGIADGTVRYMLEAYHGDSATPWAARFPFHMVGRSPEAETAQYGASETATPGGLLAQLMRHLEKKDEAMSRMLETVTKTQNKVAGDLQVRLSSFENRHLDTVRLYEDLMDRRHERESSALYRARKDAREQKAWDLGFSIVPTLAAQFLSPRLAAALPSQVQDGGPAMHLIRQLMKTLEDDQLPALMTALKPEQTIMLMELHKIVSSEVDRRNAEEEQMKNAVPTNADAMRERREAEERARGTGNETVDVRVEGEEPNK